MARVGVVLSGCGFLDGAEVHEAVLSLYFLDRAGVEIACFAPDVEQLHVVDHLSGEATKETRNVLVESARIARGRVRPLAEATIDDLDGLVIPGGFGAAKNLSSFAVDGPQAKVDGELVRLVTEAFEANKPICAICIAPAVLAAALAVSGKSAELTIGTDPGTAQAIEALGSTHVSCAVDQAAVDETHKIVTTPAYMLGEGPADVGAGIEKAIATLLRWI
jgi:enhancing lycopene biosynthesis protein 2